MSHFANEVGLRHCSTAAHWHAILANHTTTTAIEGCGGLAQIVVICQAFS